MRIFRGICRILFSLTFIISGILKLIDPVGTGLIIREYLSFMHLDFLMGAQVALGIALATLEFTMGTCTLIGLKLKFFAPLNLVVTGGFTLLTLYLAIYNPISDCGCFGEAIHLTNLQTFLKNLVLLYLAVEIFFTRNKATRIAAPAVEWTFVALFAALGANFALHAKATLPPIDFTAYKVGTDLTALDNAGGARYETTFIYSKDGKTQEFTLENLPDESWTYLDSKTTLVEGDTKMAQIDFTLEQTEGPVIALTTYDPEKLSEEELANMEMFRKAALMAGQEVITYGPTDDYELSDRKSLMTLNRSNGGAVYFYDGVIIDKWANSQLHKSEIKDVVSQDPDVIMLRHRIKEKVSVSTLVFGVLVLLTLVRYFCQFFYKKSNRH